MKQTLLFVIISISLFSFTWVDNEKTMDYCISSVDEMEFNLIINNIDTIVLSHGFNFEIFEPVNYSPTTHGYYKTYYKNQRIELVEFYADSNAKKPEYKCFVNDYDSLKYFIFLRPLDSDTFIVSHAIGVNISTSNLTMIIVTHCWENTDTIIKNSSNFAINYPAPDQLEKETKYEYSTKYKVGWIDDSYYCGRSVILIDSNLLPSNRFYFNSDFLIYFTNCEIYNDTCAEYIFSYNTRIEQTFRGKFLTNTIDSELLIQVRSFNGMWPSFIIKTFYPTGDYYFKWEFYKFFIGKTWSEYKANMRE